MRAGSDKRYSLAATTDHFGWVTFRFHEKHRVAVTMLYEAHRVPYGATRGPKPPKDGPLVRQGQTLEEGEITRLTVRVPCERSSPVYETWSCM